MKNFHNQYFFVLIFLFTRAIVFQIRQVSKSLHPIMAAASEYEL